MARHRAVVIGAGRIGAGYEWSDLAYTHAGAYQALKDRVELVGFIEPDNDRAVSAKLKWHVPVYEDIPTGVMALRPDIVSVCVQPEQQREALKALCGQQQIVGIWCEKPYVSKFKEYWPPIQVNYLRRGDQVHRDFAEANLKDYRLEVTGKDDIHTRCHFEDLARWWNVPMIYNTIPSGPCSYRLTDDIEPFDFPNGGVDGAKCMKAMLGNLLDHIDKGATLWSPPV